MDYEVLISLSGHWTQARKFTVQYINRKLYQEWGKWQNIATEKQNEKNTNATTSDAEI